jgi:cell wall-associated NlpC family hydrolase
MNLNKFIKTYDGRYLDWDGRFGCQCVDVARYYFAEVCGLKTQPAGVVGAKDFYADFEKDPVLKARFIRIPNTPTFVPQPGDVVVWDGTGGNPYGHIGIFVRGDVRAFDSLDQNLPAGAPCGVVHHTYQNVLGFLRPREA